MDAVCANIERYLSLLNEADLSPQRRTAMIKELVEEENKLSSSLEHLEFAERRAAQGRERLNQLQRMVETTRPEDRAKASRLVGNVLAIQHLLDSICHQMRTIVNSRPL